MHVVALSLRCLLFVTAATAAACLCVMPTNAALNACWVEAAVDTRHVALSLVKAWPTIYRNVDDIVVVAANSRCQPQPQH